MLRVAKSSFEERSKQRLVKALSGKSAVWYKRCLRVPVSSSGSARRGLVSCGLLGDVLSLFKLYSNRTLLSGIVLLHL
jgi:hypothetical protein